MKIFQHILAQIIVFGPLITKGFLSMNESKTRCTATSPKPRQWVLTTDSVWGLNFVVGHLGKQRNEHEQRTEKRKKKKKRKPFVALSIV
mmetsp:Transcript_42556/g.59631  ORF Transcript_42556/g.59631 Transcript_42556/m.59631 type:complete len:89 (-) Transcript_42556:4-270(-)